MQHLRSLSWQQRVAELNEALEQVLDDTPISTFPLAQLLCEGNDNDPKEVSTYLSKYGNFSPLSDFVSAGDVFDSRGARAVRKNWHSRSAAAARRALDTQRGYEGEKMLAAKRTGSAEKPPRAPRAEEKGPSVQFLLTKLIAAEAEIERLKAAPAEAHVDTGRFCRLCGRGSKAETAAS